MIIKKIDTEFLIYTCILSLLGSRLIVSVGVPSIFNFVHLGILIIIIFMQIKKGKILKSRYNVCLIEVVCIALLSSAINHIAPLNIILFLLILLEAFILVSSYEKWSERFYVKIENMLILFSLTNLILSYYQYFVLGLIDDDVRGIFLRMGSGGHLNGAFSIVMAVYFMFITLTYNHSINKIPLIVISVMNFAIVLMCDNKQSILGYCLGLVFLSVSNIKNIKKFIKSILIILLSFSILFFLISSLLPKAVSWLNNMDYVFEGIRIKLSFIETLRSNRTSILQLFLGFGPGMTLSRVARILPEYHSLNFLGVSSSNVTQQFKDFHAESWLMQSSSLWMYYFSFASFFGDIGLVGLVGMIKLYKESVKRLCNNQLSRYLMFVVVSHGLLFDWLEEPAFMVVYFVVIVLIGHKWESTKGRLIFKI